MQYSTQDEQDTTQLYVGGLPLEVNDSDLQDMFSGYGEVTYARVITDKMTNQSRGFGFVSFSTSDQASAAKEALDGAEVNEQIIAIDFARPREKRPFTKERKPLDGTENRAKLFVGNLSWNLTVDDLQTLFAQYGTISDVHIPMNAEGKPRGFAFVLFETEESATAAKDALEGQEVDGRPISIKFAIERS